jgi:hypothetical protein
MRKYLVIEGKNNTEHPGKARQHSYEEAVSFPLDRPQQDDSGKRKQQVGLNSKQRDAKASE